MKKQNWKSEWLQIPPDINRLREYNFTCRAAQNWENEHKITKLSVPAFCIIVIQASLKHPTVVCIHTFCRPNKERVVV